MKLRYSFVSILLAAIFAAGCQETAETYPAIYITEAQVNADKSMTIDVPPAETKFTISSSVLVDEDVDVELEICPDLLESFNKKNGKNYQIPPTGCYELSTNKVKILAGYNTSAEVGFIVNDIAQFKEGVTYCVPIRIKNVSKLNVLDPSRTLFIVLKTPVISKAIYLGGSNIYTIKGFKNNSDLAALPQLTLEARVYMNGFCNHDPYISSIIGKEGVCMVRFGDVKVPKDCLQICHDSYQPAAADKPLQTKRWYHVAAVWSGSSWDLYIDGQFATGVPTGGELMNLAEGRDFYIGASYGRGRPLNGYVAECRVWTRALSQSEIANNMNYVDPASEGLLAYWRMNAWEPGENGGNVVKDLTGHGFDAYGDSSNPSMIDTKWL